MDALDELWEAFWQRLSADDRALIYDHIDRDAASPELTELLDARRAPQGPVTVGFENNMKIMDVEPYDGLVRAAERHRTN